MMRRRRARVSGWAIAVGVFVGALVGTALWAPGRLGARRRPGAAESPLAIAPIPGAPGTGAPHAEIDPDWLIQQARALPAALTAVYFQEPGRRAIGYLEEEPVPAASVIKLAIMATLYERWERGSLPRLPEDEARLRRMITRSDNQAANTLIDRLGMDTVNNFLRRQGCAISSLRRKIQISPRGEDENVVTAREMGLLLARMLTGELVGPTASAEMAAWLRQSERRTRISALLPKGTPCGSKTGTLRGLVHDVGFVQAAGRRWVLCLLTAGVRDVPGVERGMARLSRAIYNRLADAGRQPSANSPQESAEALAHSNIASSQ
ncbi:MAG: serine hydrolase [Armatimonadetes bacterium]|nr:serine hydrolase [Armatimonadota bacterium]